MDELEPGLYETLVTEGLKAQLDELAERLPTEQRSLQSAETPDRIAWHLSRQIERALADVGDNERVQVGLSVAQDLLGRLGELVEVDRSALPVDPVTGCTRSSGGGQMAARRSSTNHSFRCSTRRC